VLLIGVGAAGNDLRHNVALASADLFEPGGTALVLDGVMQESGDCLIFARAVLQCYCGNRQQVRDIRRVGALASLLAV
jgi:hypothetical protein